MKVAKSIEHIKRVGEYIPKGAMLRQTLLNVRPRKLRHNVRVACDMWRVSTPRGNLYWCEGHHFLCVSSANYKLVEVCNFNILMVDYYYTGLVTALAAFNEELAKLNVR